MISIIYSHSRKNLLSETRLERIGRANLKPFHPGVGGIQVMASCGISVWDAQVNRYLELCSSFCNRASFSLLVHGLTSISCALSRKLPRRREVVKSTTTCFSNTSTKWHVFDMADLPMRGVPCVLLRAGRRCTRRGHSDGT